MSIQNRTTLKSYFNTGDQPTEANFVDLIDSLALVSGDTITGPLVLNADPTLALGAATKSYVDNLITGLTWKQSVVVATTANITRSGTQTIDGIALQVGDRVLVKNQSAAAENGIFIVAAGAWTRALDSDSGAEIANTTVLCEAGTVNGGTQWNCSNTAIIVDTTGITFVTIAGAGVYSNGTGIALTGNVFSIDATVATLAGTQTLTNKTLTSPSITTPTGIVKNDVGLGNVDNTSDATKNSATVTLTNKTLTSPKINVGADATGDIYYRDAGGNLARLAIGSSTQVLIGGTIPSYASLVSVLGYTPVNKNGDTMTGPLVLNADPTATLGAATKGYVDTSILSSQWKKSVEAATTANITLSGTQTIDGVSLSVGNRVLVKNQTDSILNGIYVVSSGTWSRAEDNNGPNIKDTNVACNGGTVNYGTVWSTFLISFWFFGFDGIYFVKIAGRGLYTNGVGLSLNDNSFSIDSTIPTIGKAVALANNYAMI